MNVETALSNEEEEDLNEFQFDESLPAFGSPGVGSPTAGLPGYDADFNCGFDSNGFGPDPLDFDYNSLENCDEKKTNHILGRHFQENQARRQFQAEQSQKHRDFLTQMTAQAQQVTMQAILHSSPVKLKRSYSGYSSASSPSPSTKSK